jgi:hypothetical protein
LIDWKIRINIPTKYAFMLHKFWFPIYNDVRFWNLSYIQDGPLLICPRKSSVVFQWATKGAKQNRTLNANSIDRTSLPISLDQINNLHKPEQLSHNRIYVTTNAMSFCSSEWNDTAPTGRSFVKFDTWTLLKIRLQNSSFITMWQE